MTCPNKEFPTGELGRTLDGRIQLSGDDALDSTKTSKRQPPRGGVDQRRDSTDHRSGPPPASKLAHKLWSLETAINLKRGLVRKKGKGDSDKKKEGLGQASLACGAPQLFVWGAAVSLFDSKLLHCLWPADRPVFANLPTDRRLICIIVQMTPSSNA